MRIARSIAAAALGSAMLSVPALAQSVTFAQFTQQDNNKIAQYTNTGSGNLLTIARSPANFVVTDFGPAGISPTFVELSASSSALVTSTASAFQQTGWSGTIRFGDDANNLLTAVFSGATFAFDGDGGSASLINTDPTGSITYSSNVFAWPAFETKNFSLAFSGITPTFTIAANGFGSAFNANIAGSFAGDPDGDNPSGEIPEPASWAMMIVGFGLTGNAMRRRNRVRVVTC